MSDLVFTTTDKLSVEHGIKVCLFGPAGFGKTMMAATAPRPLLAMVENGTLSLTPKNIERVFGVGTPGISYKIPCVKLNSVDDLEKLYKQIYTPALWNAFDTLYLDSATEIVEKILNTELSKKSNSGAKVNGMAAFGDMAELTIEWFKKLRDIPGKHVVITCEQGIDKSTGLYAPSMPGNKLPQKVPHLFDLILQVCVAVDPATGKRIRYLRTQPDNDNFAKDRSGVLDIAGELPNLTSIINKIKASV